MGASGASGAFTVRRKASVVASEPPVTYRNSVAHGVNALEVSLARSSDGVWFGLHDKTLDRTSGTHGFVAAEHSWAQISKLRITAAETTDPTQPTRPYLRFEELAQAYARTHTIFVDPKVVSPQYFPELLPNLSTCKSPQQMLGALVKELLPVELGAEKKNLVMVSIMPCTAKKFEAKRPEFAHDGIAEVDHVLTTQELARMIEEAGLRFTKLAPESFDMPMGFKTGAGVIFGNSGGVSEAVLRYAASQARPIWRVGLKAKMSNSNKPRRNAP